MPSLPRRLLPLLLVVATILLPPSFGPLGVTSGQAQQDPLQATTKTVNVELILDASGSMAEVLPEGETRMAAAKRILRGVIEGLPERAGINVGLRVYGHRGDNTETGKQVSCRSSELLVPVAGLDKAALIAQVESIQPTGWTPIAHALQQAAADFQPGGESITNAIVLVTDGEETCDPPPQSCDAASALHQSDVSVTTHVVGFALNPQQTELVRCIAEQGGGQLFGANDAAELGTAIGSALEGVGVSITPVAIPPAAPVAPAPPAVPLTDIRTLAYHQLTQWSAGANERGEEAPILSDDGQRIAFARAPGTGDPASPNRIFMMNADGSGEQEVDAYTSLCFCGALIDISADGSRIVSSDAVQLRIAETSGGGGRELLALDSNELNAVRISGDGSTIVFRIYRDTTIRTTSPSQPIARGIYRINADGSGLQQLVGPTQMGALLGVAPEQAPFFGGSSGLDTATNGGRIVFTSITADIDPATSAAREGLFAVNGDGTGLHRLLGPTSTFVQANAISGDGAHVAYVTHDFGTGLQQAGVLGFDGGGQRILTDSTSRHPGTDASLPSGERIQLSSDGSRLLLGSTGLLYDTASGDLLALGVGTPWFSTDPAPLVIDGLYRATMNAAATRALYLFQAYPEPYQLVQLDLNPADLGGAPAITDPSISPAYILTEGRSTATVSARVSTTNTLVRVSSRVLRDGLPDDNTRPGPLLDDGAGPADAASGDVMANDGLFTSNGISTDCCAEVGPRTMRIKAETQAADGLRHATAIDVSPFQVSTDPVEGGPPPAAPAPTTPLALPGTPVTPPPVTSPPTACSWTGTWNTSFGAMRLTQSGGTVSGEYDHDQGQIRGTVSGTMLSGTWDEVPSRQPPSDAGELAFTMADDCQRFSGRWRYDASGDWQPGWDGQREEASAPVVTPMTPAIGAGSVTPLPVTPPAGGDAAAQATIAAQATRIAELQGQIPTPTPVTAAPAPPETAEPQLTAHAEPPQLAVGEIVRVRGQSSGVGLPIFAVWLRDAGTESFTEIVRIDYEGRVQRRAAGTRVLELVEASGGASGFDGVVEVTFQATAVGGAEIMVDASGEVATEFGYASGGAGSDPLLITVVETGAATPSPTGAVTSEELPPATDVITPDPAECTATPRTAEALAALTAAPDQTATDALVLAAERPGLEIPAGTPADAATTAAVVDTYRQITACGNAGNTLAAYALWTDDALRQLQVPPPSSAVPTTLPDEERSAFRVTEVRVLPDGRVVAVWEERGPIVATTVVQVLLSRDGRYLIDETLDAMSTTDSDDALGPQLATPATPAGLAPSASSTALPARFVGHWDGAFTYDWRHPFLRATGTGTLRLTSPTI